MALRISFPRICIALGICDPAQLIEAAEHEAEGNESFLEFRLDYLSKPEQGIGIIRTVAEHHPGCAILATCRRHQNHGRFNGSAEDQIRILEGASAAGAHAVDVEIETAELSAERLQKLRENAKLIISYHNFEGTPHLEQVINRMTRVSADAYKIVTTARKPSDCGRILSLARANPKIPMIVLSMGETGFPTRVLSTSFSSLFTYAAPTHLQGTANGQISAQSLRRLYRIDKLSKASRIYGVVADPVRHSISPAVHNRGFQARRLDAVYLPFLVAPAHLKDFMELATVLPVAGFSVTIPHKQKILRYLDSVDPLARRIGAVNTVWRKAGKWRGANTDAAGVTVPLARHMRPGKSSVLIIGNGGAARGAACALLDAGAKVTLTGRNPDRVRALAKACGADPLVREQLTKHHFDAVVHATPLGLFPHSDGCFFDGPIPADVVFDLVYNPLETTLIKRAKEQKKVVIPGVEMFIEQAVRQFEIWTGETAPRSAMEKAAFEALQTRL